jgi:hypothetical protein
MSGIASTGTGLRGKKPVFHSNGEATIPNIINAVRKINVTSLLYRKYLTNRLNIACFV